LRHEAEHASKNQEAVGEQASSPERALAILRRIQTHRVLMPNKRTVTGISTIDAEQSAIFDSLGVKKPTATDRYTCL
jgi:hypothetical protein